MHVKMLDRKSLGDRLRSERKRLGWSQEEAGVHLGVGRSALASYEVGRSCPDAELLELAREHGMDAWYLLTGHRSQEAAIDMLDERLFATTLRAVHQFLEENELALDPDKEFALVKILYRQFARLGKMDQKIFNDTMKVA